MVISLSALVVSFMSEELEHAGPGAGAWAQPDMTHRGPLC